MSAPHTELTPTSLTEPGMRGVVRVLGGAGTGKSSLLIQAATAHIAAGCDPESVLLLTGSARLGSQARAAITSALLSAGSRAVVREPLVRTVHSYAFAVLRLAAQRNGDPPPRLITSAEQDGIIRELLAGDLEDVDSPPQAGGPPACEGSAPRDAPSRTSRANAPPTSATKPSSSSSPTNPRTSYALMTR